MSHMRVLVIIPAEEADNAKDAVRARIAKYDENLRTATETDDDGEIYSFNPLVKWDWWCIGGRYCGHFVMDDYDSVTDDCAYGGTRFHPQGCPTPDYHRNVLPMTELRPGWSAWAIVTPDGEWHEKGKMGWFGASHGDDPNWDAMKYEIASAYPEHYAVCVDCHI